jgi:beta-N-acetylhexosaminidase
MDAGVNAHANAAAEDVAAKRRQASRIAAALNDSQLAAQVIITGIDGRGQPTPGMKILLGECPAGGVILFKYTLDTDNNAIQELLGECAALISSGSAVELSNDAEADSEKTPAAVMPFVAVDHEGGAINRFRRGVADLPSAAYYRETAQNSSRELAIAQIYTDSLNAGKAINSLGVNFNFAPVAEYLNENNRLFLEERAYSSDPSFVAKASAAFIMGMEQAGLLCAIKHFPGSAGADPHLYPAVLGGSRETLAELVGPFAALVQDGHAHAVIVSHSTVPAWDGDTIASLSPVVMGDWLRQELGFNGIIISDDFSMTSASAGGQRSETLAVQSLAAGTDMVIVWPPDLRRTHREIQAALSDGRLTRERLREAAGRIIFEKMRLGLIDGE